MRLARVFGSDDAETDRSAARSSAPSISPAIVGSSVLALVDMLFCTVPAQLLCAQAARSVRIAWGRSSARACTQGAIVSARAA
jgi:hypothetical protein